ncbi:DUF1275 domain-containing protein [Roseovarius sp. SCSIO 43702]|uniref:YoaK family protein n=1 Tax=Roseovarius sp. SCSIO 43702 TaxID=2823043 RepID=UPI001C730490|nr:YoaK family protein [Roseovarius sp. SCSIO 43702]QYX57148.1 DUF1275 domain-containing protein [Roseovarius sp. SCSIO 43702]
MITKLPNWIEYGAFLLAAIAGFVNSVGLLGLDHVALSHVSGTTSLFGVAIFEGAMTDAGLLAALLCAFFLGSVISGLVVRDTALRLDRRYDTALMVEALLILVAYGLLSAGSPFGHLAAAMACGVQNALATTYSGAVVRTTHLTGIFTDLGIMVGSFLRGETFGKRKAILFLLIIGGFVAGGAAGAWLFGLFGFGALLAPALMCAALALAFRVYRAAQLTGR